jgi:hypothetical protein
MPPSLRSAIITRIFLLPCSQKRRHSFRGIVCAAFCRNFLNAFAEQVAV